MIAALLIQIVVWGMVKFTDMRWGEVATVNEPGRVVIVDEVRGAVPSPFDEPVGQSSEANVNPNRVLTLADRIFDLTASLAGGFGTLAVLTLMPLVGLGVLLAAGSATRGVDRTVSAFGWALVALLLALPLGGMLGLPWEDGGFWIYDKLATQVDAAAAVEGSATVADGSGVVAFEMLARYLLLPCACAAAIVLVGVRFGQGVEAGAFRKENLALDMTLEQEAGDIKAGTLHGGRTAATMTHAMASIGNGGQKPAPGMPAGASARHLTAGEMPKRLI